jgi:ATP-binding cassette, subfamily B, beta-glucan exporter
MTAEKMTIFDIYKRALSLLSGEKYLAFALAAAGVIIAAVQLAEPVLFGRVVDAMNTGEGAFSYIALWAALGIFGILAGVIVATYSDRLAHRQKLLHLADVYERAMALPQHYHAERGSGAVIRTILSGTSSLFWLWLGAMRDQLTSLFGIILLVPTALSIDWRMAVILLGLAAAYTVMNVIVMHKTDAGQSAVEDIGSNLSGRVVDVIGNV